jgi:hypothetical protein
MPVSALRHQLAVAETLASTHKSQRGLLVYHQVGSGKTLTGLVLAMTYASRPTLIVCPEPLGFVWREQIKLLGITKKMHIMTYKQLADRQGMIKGAVVIIDEAHNLVDKIAKSSPKYAHLIRALQTCHKLLLLTGTPITSAVRAWSDLSTLVNLAAGSTVIPYGNKQFEKEFMLVNWKNAVKYGYGLNALSQLLSTILRVSQRELLQQARLLPARLLHLGAAIRHLWSSLVAQVVPLKLLRRDVEGAPARIAEESARFAVSVYIRQKMFEHEDSMLYLNREKLSAAVRDYVSFFKSTDRSVLPTVVMTTEYVTYDALQEQYWLRMCSEALQASEVADLLVDSNERLVGQFMNMSGDWEHQLAGRSIGSLCLPTAHAPYFCPKFRAVLRRIQASAGSRAVVYSEIEASFLMFQRFLRHEKVAFQVLLQKMPEAKKLRVLQDFKDGAVQILLLDPEMYEGVSILGATQLHVLEPLSQVHKQEQAIARVCRYRSHHHLDPEQRQVHVYLWCAVVSNALVDELKSGATASIQRLKLWYTSYRHLLPPIPFLFRDVLPNGSRLNKNLSPDSVVLNRTTRIQRRMSQFVDFLQATQDGSQAADCCVWRPSDDEMQTCLSKLPKCAAD